MLKFIEKNTPLILFLFFLVFYALQVSQFTYKADIIAFAVRSANDFPILDYAYLHSQTLPSGESLPNYHLGHTLILWLIYHLVPDFLANSLLPAAFFAVLCGSLVIVLTFLIWIQIGIKKKTALFIAITFALVPTFWEHATIGEIHSLQLLFILLFIYFFLKNKFFLSTLFFLFANLVSPLSGFAITFIFLKGINKSTIKNGIIISLSALLIYIIIFAIIGADFLALLSPGSYQPSGRGIFYRVFVLGVFIILNYSFFIYYLYKGIKLSLENEKTIILQLSIAVIPQLLLVFISSGFVIEYGSFQLLLFWALSFPLGYYLSTISLKSNYFIFALIFSISLTYYNWLLPHRSEGKSLNEAGTWLKNNKLEKICIVGPWNAGINIIQARNGYKMDLLNKCYFDVPYPSDIDLMKINKDELLIVNRKKNYLRRLVAKTNIKGFAIKEYSPINIIEYGEVKKIYENDFTTIFRWKK